MAAQIGGGGGGGGAQRLNKKRCPPEIVEHPLVPKLFNDVVKWRGRKPKRFLLQSLIFKGRFRRKQELQEVLKF